MATIQKILAMIKVIAIAAATRNGAIGRNGQLIQRHKEDLEFFKSFTTGKKVLFGRKTFESIGHALKDRQNLMLTTDANFKAEGVAVFNSIASSINSLSENDTLIIAGGGEVYKATMAIWSEFYLTVFDCDCEDADVFLPQWCDENWTLKSSLDLGGGATLKHFIKRNGYIPNPNIDLDSHRAYCSMV